MRRRSFARRRKYGRHGSVYPKAGTRSIDELLREQYEREGAPTVRRPYVSIHEEVEGERRRRRELR